MLCNHRFLRLTTPLSGGVRRFASVLTLCLALAATLLTSCSHDTPDPQPTHAVVLYFPWTDGLESLLADNIEDIKTAMAARQQSQTERVLLIKATARNEAQLIEISIRKGQCRETLLKTYTGWSFTDKSNILTMFNDAASRACAQTYSMIIGAHGTGWLPRESRPGQAKAFGGTTPATKTNICTLDSAIVESGIRHLEYLCFDDCYMANIETAYQLRDATDYLIASTSEIMNVGIPYADAWAYMCSAAPDYSAVVSCFHAFYTSYSYPYGALSVTDCRKTERAAQLMRTLNAMLSDAGISPSDLSPQVLDGFDAHVFFDMKDYTDRALAALGTPEPLASQFEALYSDMIVAHSSTPRLYSDFIPGSFSVLTNCGLTISDPTVNTEAAPHLVSTPFWIATH